MRAGGRGTVFGVEKPFYAVLSPVNRLAFSLVELRQVQDCETASGL